MAETKLNDNQSSSNLYTKFNLFGGKDCEIVPEPAVVVAYSYVPYTSGYGSGPFPELLYSSASSIEQGVTTNYYTDVELTNLYGSTSGYTNASGRLVIRSGSTAKCEMRLLDGTPVEKSSGNMVVNYVEKQNMDYVVESYSDEDGNWYRVWKSGWLEQSGIVPIGSNTYVSVSFLKPFADTNYYVSVPSLQDNSAVQSMWGAITAKSESNTYFKTLSLAYVRKYYACGQGA